MEYNKSSADTAFFLSAFITGVRAVFYTVKQKYNEHSFNVWYSLLLYDWNPHTKTLRSTTVLKPSF